MEINKYRLPGNIKPDNYYIKIKMIKDNFDIFEGETTIQYRMIENTEMFILNGNNLHIEKASIISENKEYPCLSIDYQDDISKILLNFETIPSKGKIKFKYVGKINDSLMGFYKAKDNGKYVFFTQFEPVYARFCFPCFDEPHFKAKFSLEIELPEDKLVLSNTSIKYKKVTNNTIIYIFKETPIMSTYLLAFYIGKADCLISYTKNGTTVRTFHSGDIRHMEFGINVAVKCIELLEIFFDIPYPLDKLDLIGIPQMSAAAMENWGLIIMRERSLICDEVTSLMDKIDIAYIICHEIAHQWFGNLVTMKWWSDLWLNESFATWAGWMIVDKIFPEWNVWELFYCREILGGLKLDSLKNSHPIAANVINPTEISEVFDAISYSKGSVIINMICHYMKMENFRRGLAFYFNKFKYQNASTQDLWDSLKIYSRKSIDEMVQTWIKHKNYPLVNVTLINPNSIKIKQELFYFDNKQRNNIIWCIPLCNGLVISKEMITVERKNIKGIINKDSLGFYRLNFDNNILDNLLDNNFDMLSTLDIVGRIDDLFTLCKDLRISFSYYLTVLEKILSKTSDKNPQYSIWNIIKNNYYYFYLTIEDDELINGFKGILSNQNKMMKKYIFTKIDKNNINSTNLFRIFLMLLCDFEDQEALEYCLELFDAFYDNYRKNNYLDSIDPNIIDIIFRVAVRYRSEKAYHLFFEILNNPKYEVLVLCSIDSIQEKDKFFEFLNIIFNGDIGNQNKFLIVNAAATNKKFRQYLWPFLKENWNAIYHMFKNDHFGIQNIIKGLSSLINNDNLINDLEDFFKNREKKNMEKALELAIENIQINTRFTNNILIN